LLIKEEFGLDWGFVGLDLGRHRSPCDFALYDFRRSTLLPTSSLELVALSAAGVIAAGPKEARLGFVQGYLLG
jgi:hypothetical protein